MTRQAILLAGVAMICAVADRAMADIFSDCEEIYVAVANKIVREHTRSDRALAITTAIEEEDPRLRYLEDQLWKRLEAKGVDRTKLVPFHDVVFEEASLRCVHRPSGKIVWVHEIGGLDWYGDDRIYVSRYIYRNPWDFEAVEPPFVFRKQDRVWSFVVGQDDAAVERPGVPQSAVQPERTFLDLEEIYLRAFATFVRDHGDLDRVLCVAMATPESTGPVKMPDRMWQQLSARLQARGEDVSRFVPADQIDWKEQGMHFVHRPTGRNAWVYSINAVQWYGADWLHVPISVNHGNLAAGGDTLVFQKSHGEWIIVNTINHWES